MKKVILDTNFLVYCAKEKVDYAEDLRIFIQGKYDLVVPSQVIEELEELKNNAKKYQDRTSASLALKILKVNNVKILPTEEKTTDKSIIKLSKEEFGNMVATLDLGLIKKVKKPIILRGRQRLSFR